jgi:hypothetical protein
MTIKLTIKNYRCFVSPVTIEIGKGFTAFVGVNNAGKSTIMRFLLEMRQIFNLICDRHHLQTSLAHQNGVGGFAPLHVVDPQEIFSNLNSDGLEFWFEFKPNEGDETPAAAITKAIIKVRRDFMWTCDIFVKEQILVRGQNGVGFAGDNQNRLIRETTFVADVAPLRHIASILANTLYIGPFRNTINVGAKTDYLDIQIGDAFIKQFRGLKTGLSKLHSAGIQNLTENIKKLFEFDSLDIIPSADDSSLHITVNGKPIVLDSLSKGQS